MAKASKKSEDQAYDPWAARRTVADNGPAVEAHTVFNLAKLRRAKEDQETTSGSYRNTRKHVEGKGIHLKAADRTLSIIKAGKVEDWLAETAKVVEYLYALGHGVEERQLAFEFLQNPAMPGEDKARVLGRLAGLRGDGDGENPYGVGSDQYNAWIDGLRDGQREYLVTSAEEAGSERIAGGDPFDAADPAREAAE